MPRPSDRTAEPLLAEDLGTEFATAVRRVARTSHLLVCCDYDGTLAPIVSDPAAARPLPEGVAALRLLATLPNTATAVVSGRALRDLAVLSRLPSEVHLVGSHGSEFDAGFVNQLDPHQRHLRDELKRALGPLVAGTEGAFLEEKPASLAVHVRNSDPDPAAALLEAVASGPATWPGVHAMHGKMVLELSVAETDKGEAVDTLRHLTGATAALFVGDDVTDERAFARLGGDDVGVKVGEGESLAAFRVGSPHDVARLLALLAQERQWWFTGGNAPSIEDHSLLSDEHTVALLDPGADINWLCFPSPESPAVFASILGDPFAGSFRIAPASGDAPLAQTYLRDSMAVRTRWPGLSVVDFFDYGDDTRPKAHPHYSTLIRVISGTSPAQVTFAPRPEFGSVPVRLEAFDGGVLVRGGGDPMILVSPGVEWQVIQSADRHYAQAQVDPSAGEVVLELRLGVTDPEPHELAYFERRDRTSEHYGRWLARLALPPRYRDIAARSALTLKALTHRPTGAIIAAATTSLPEWIGGIRNWDYRYCWIRDASMTASALVELGSTTEAEHLLAWVSNLLADGRRLEDLRPLYGVDGHALGPEAVIENLPGYAGSRPVRVGNAAQGQVQLDVFGPLLDLLATITAHNGSVTEAQWQLTAGSIEAVADRWEEPDHGIWEIRDLPRHNVHSRMMCWVSVERAIRIAGIRGVAVPDWHALLVEIASDIEAHGYDERLQTYVSAYGRQDVDAAVLHALGLGYEAPAERIAGTIAAVEKHLRRGPTVYRYRYDDGLPGDEGGMNICTSWLVETYVRAGQIDEAEELFEALLDRAGVTGLVPEMVEPGTWRGLGNHPQAYSHLGIIRCALALQGVSGP